MNESNTFWMWGERGLVATFFADLYQIDNMKEVDKFLKSLQFLDPLFQGSKPPEHIHFIIEPDFSEFGQPDAILKVNYKNHCVVIIVEAKRTDFKTACNKRRGQNGYNSTLKGQLELDYRLTRALSKFKNDEIELTEPHWEPINPYGDKRRSLKNPNVLKGVVAQVSGEDLDLSKYYYLVITTDEQNPFNIVDESFLPQLFGTMSSGRSKGFMNNWEKFHKQFGWLNYEKMETFIAGVQDQLPLGSLFLPTYQLNKANLKSQNGGDKGKVKHRGRGVSLIYAPEIYPETFVHFSWWKRCATRDYSKSEIHQPRENRYGTSYIENLIKQEIAIKKKRPIHDVSFWHRLVIETNRKKGLIG